MYSNERFWLILFPVYMFIIPGSIPAEGIENPDVNHPNLILIIADDMAWGDCGACSHPNIQTPNIDKQANDGMMFHQAFLTTSSCSPSQSSIITGTYPHQTDAEQLYRELPRDKTTMYDSGIKTPWILKWPERVEAGSHTESLVSVINIGTTFLALAGIESFESSPGRDFSPILTDPDVQIHDRIYGQAHWHDHENFVRAVRDDCFKYIKNFFNDLPRTPPADALTGGTFGEIPKLERSNDGVPRLRTPDEFHRVSGAPLPNNELPRDLTKEMFGGCECIYLSPEEAF